VTACNVPPVDFVRAQIDACFDDFRIGAVKLGMLANTQLIDECGNVDPAAILLRMPEPKRPPGDST
jgi:hypothetical protein